MLNISTQIAQEYQSDVSEDAHIKNIIKLSTYITENHKNLLRNGRFRIGTAQKALNLHLKYLWCLGKIDKPPHCPFGFQIIKKLPNYKGYSWTALDTEKHYRDLVTAAKLEAKDVSLAIWELQTYNNDQSFNGTPKQINRVVGKNKNTKSAEAWLRELLSVEGAEYTIEQLVEKTGKTEVNIKTKLNDLRSEKFCGKEGVFKTESVRKGGKLFYRKS